MRAEFALFVVLLGVVEAAPKVVSFDISRSTSPISSLGKRDGASKHFTGIVRNAGAGNGYTVNITIGTPPQSITVGIDTGSTETWILSKTADYCVNQTLVKQGKGCVGGTFDTGISSSLKTVGEGEFKARYVDGSGSSGDYITDVLSIGGISLKDMQMGLAFNSTGPQGTLGLSYSTLENTSTPYPAFIDQLQAQGQITTKVFSLYLNNLAASAGNLLFGGIDTSKFSGSLTTIPLVPDISKATASSPNGVYTSFFVPLVSVSVTGQKGNTTDFPMSSTASDGSKVAAVAVVLDSGSVFTYLPSTAVKGIYSLLNAVQSPKSPFFIYVDCALLTSQKDLTVNFHFSDSSGPVIKVSLSELIFPLDAYGPLVGHISALGTLPFKDTCMIGLVGSELIGGAMILGDTFLRSAYVVYDLENNQVAVAQAMFGNQKENIVEIGKGALPVVTGVSSSSSVSSTASTTATTGSTTATGGASHTASTGGEEPTGTGSGAATSSTSRAAGMASSPPPFDIGGFLVLGVAGFFSLAGAGWFLA